MAEDSRTQRRIYESFLKGDFEVALFENGRPLLDAVLERMPDLVISDLEMPVMDGLELTRLLKGDPATRPLPVILLTAGDGRSVSSCLDAGADDFLRKPVQADELAARARSCVRAFATYKELQANHGELRATYARLVQAEERTRASEARLSAILEGAHDAILTVDGAGQIASFNCAAERMFGWNRTEIGAIPFLELVSPGAGRTGLAERLAELAAGGVAERHEAVGRRRSGEEFPVECSLTRVDTADGPMVCAFLRDLTTSRQMEAALRQVQQLEAIGRMAGGIAHEINTPVQCIQDSLEFLRQSFEALEPVLSSYRDLAAAVAGDHAELVGRTRSAEEDADLEFTMEASPPAAKRALDMARRIVAIVRATQDFAGPEGGAGTVELHSTLRSVLEVSRPLYADVAEVELDAEPLLVPGHAGELNEAFRHLVLNAAHAIADAGRRGTIRVLARADGDDVVVSVSDNGCGVSPDIAHRIFDPFFTTKEVGRGVGLGLFVASAAARHHNGTLTFESEPGRGSTFRMRVARQRAASNDHR